MGWDMVRLAKLLAVRVDRLRRIVNDDAPASGIPAGLANDIARIYLTLSKKTAFHPPHTGPYSEERAAVQRTLKHAAAAGWLPPLSWTARTIDDPAAEPRSLDPAAVAY
jgi:hypothetical protein